MKYLLFSLTPMLMGNELSKKYGFIIIGFVACIWLMDALNKKDMLFLAEPSSLIVTYTLLSIFFGSFGYQYEFILNDRDEQSWYHSWKYFHVALSFYILSISILINGSNRDYKTNTLMINYARSINLEWQKCYLIPFAVLIPFFFIDLNLDVLGGSGDLSILPKTLAAILIFVNIQGHRLLLRFALYFATIVFFVTFSINDKREAIFLVFPIAWLEFLRIRYSLNFAGFFILIGVLFCLLTLILLMSISRGYGGFGEYDSIVDAAPYLIKYVSSDMFFGGLLNNIEASSFFFNGSNAINYVLENDVYTFGSTLIKFLFVFFPRDVFPEKPNSIIDIYTTAYDPAYRAIGGSDPINIFAEYFWNFHMFGLVIVLFLAFLVIRLSKYMYRCYIEKKQLQLSCGLIAYMNLLTLLRGSGMDQYVVYMLITFFFAFLGYIVMFIFVSLQRGFYVWNSRCDSKNR